MSDNDENTKIKLTLNNLAASEQENKIKPADIPPQNENQDTPPEPKIAFKPSPSPTKTIEGLELKLKNPEIKLSEVKAKSIPIPIPEVKLKAKLPNIGNTENVLPQSSIPFPPPLKSPAKTEEEHPSLNIADSQKEKTQRITLKKETTSKPVINLDEITLTPQLIEKNDLPPKENQTEETNKNVDHFDVLSTGNEKKNISDTVKLRLKPKTASPSAFSALTSEEKSQIPIEKSDSTAQDSIKKPIDKTVKKNIRYIYLAAALIIMITLLYFLISTIKTLMTI